MVQNENEFHRGVCFSREKHRFFEKIAVDNSNSGIEVKRFKFGDYDIDIIVNDFTSVKSRDLNFIHKLLELTNFTVEQYKRMCHI